MEINRNVNSKIMKLPKSVLLYFMTLQFGFGFGMGFENIFHGKKQTTSKYFSNVLSIISIIVLISPVDTMYTKPFFWLIFIKYNGFVIVLKTIPYKVFDYLTEMQEFGGSSSSITKNFVGTWINIYILGMSIIKMGVVSICYFIGTSDYCILIKNPLHHFIFDLTLNALDSVFGTSIFVVYYVYCGLKEIKETFKLNKDVTNLEKRYVALAKLWEKMFPLHSGLIIIELCINTPRLMVTLWCMLLYIKENAEWYSYTSEWLFAFHLTMQMCIPAVVAEMVNGQMDAIKTMLNEQLRIEKDKEKSAELNRVLRYIKARNLQNDIWRLIPLDLRLPLTLLSICTTYFIVILQFTHLYD